MKLKLLPKGKRLLITGIPRAGKTTLAKKLAEAIGGIYISIDDIRKELKSDPKYTDAVNFYRNQDKKTYYMQTSYDQQWKNLVTQSEKLWDGILQKINSFSGEEKPIIFEGVNLLPHLIYKDLDFPVIVKIGATFQEILERNEREPRWGSTELELQSEAFFLGERPHYKAEAKKYSYPVFETSDEAFKKAFKILG